MFVLCNYKATQNENGFLSHRQQTLQKGQHRGIDNIWSVVSAMDRCSNKILVWDGNLGSYFCTISAKGHNLVPLMCLFTQVQWQGTASVWWPNGYSPLGLP